MSLQSHSTSLTPLQINQSINHSSKYFL